MTVLAEPVREAGAAGGSAVLSVRGLYVDLVNEQQSIQPVSGISFEVNRGETVAIVGESGSGKSMTAAAIMQLLPPGATLARGAIEFEGKDLTAFDQDAMRAVRGKWIALMPQDPMTALNPSLTIGYQVAEPLVLHSKASWSGARSRVVEILGETGIPDPQSVLGAYPHQLSGGMRQRVVLAMALIARPLLLIADEPTTALDVTTQEQIIDLLQDLQEKFGLSIVLITHDLGVVARIADRVLVMYAGRQLEYGPAEAVFLAPGQPYTRGLLDSVDFGAYAPGDYLRSISGAPPRMNNLPSGCVFRDRCPFAREVCVESMPELKTSAFSEHPAACHVLHSGDLPTWSR